MNIEEMKQVDRARAQLDQLDIQVANREAGMKRDAANAALIQFKTYFANRDFTFSGNEWNVSATHGSINFALTIKNAPTGGPECLILKYPEMLKRPPKSIFLEALPNPTAASAKPAPTTPKSLLEEVSEQIMQMREKLAAPAKKWIYFTLVEQAGAAPQRKDYTSFDRLLAVECP